MDLEHPPAPSRRRRRPILRVRTGCLTCRARKKKCDEVKPICAGCRRNSLICQWPHDSATVQRRERLNGTLTKATSTTASATAPGDVPGRDGSFEIAQTTLDAGAAMDMGQHASPRRPGSAPDSAQSTSSGSPSSTLPPLVDTFAALQGTPEDAEPEDLSLYDDLMDAEAVDVESILPDGEYAASALMLRPRAGSPGLDVFRSVVPRTPSMIPGLGSQSYDLMGHYLSRTAHSMGNGSTVANPFIVQLVPLSFASDVIRDLVLSQSATHRANGLQLDSADSAKAVAQRHYTRSIRLFRNAIDDYLAGSEPSPLWIAIGGLIMCFTETAKGDTNGVVLDHLNAVGPLLADLVCRHRDVIREDLRNFIVEYYIYTAVTSIISIDPAISHLPLHLMQPGLLDAAQSLVDAGYIGQLCGCWMQLLLLIPQIFEFGRRGMASGADPPFPCADDFMEFARLQAEILAYAPSPLASFEVTLVAYVFQQTVHIYLLTVFDTDPQSAAGLHLRSLDDAVHTTYVYLDQLPGTAQLNTSLCWPLAVVGCCTRAESQRERLRARLASMFATLSLGNVRLTSTLLSRIWEKPLREQNPWALCRVMRENRLWTSFA